MIRLKLRTFTLIGALMFLSSCMDGPKASYDISDHYHVYLDDRDYFLICKLSCESDARVDNIINVKWNQKAIFLTTGSTNSKEYYIVIARGSELRCCNNDLLLGPLGKADFDSIMFKYSTVKDRSLAF